MADSDTPMAEPAGKRKRTEVSGVQHTTQSEPWFKDGNIVLEAEGWQFRVHRSILAAHSSILEATFETPQSPKTQLVEGCPVVRLSDTAQDLEYVLKALCYRSYVAVGLAPIPMSVVSAFLRLGKKYEIDILQAEATKRLTYECPSSLEDFDKLEFWSMIEAEDGLPIEIVKLGRENGLLSVVPIALYCCCRCYSALEILKGVKGRAGDCISLSQEDREACIVANQRIIQAQATTTFLWMNPGTAAGSLYKSCRSPASCSFARKDLLCEMFLPLPKSIALDLWEGQWEKGMCSACVEAAKASHNEGREKMWEDLPSFFNMTGWTELLER